MRFTVKTEKGDYILSRDLYKIGTTSLVVADKISNKLGRLEDLEEKLEIDLCTFVRIITLLTKGKFKYYEMLNRKEGWYFYSLTSEDFYVDISKKCLIEAGYRRHKLYFKDYGTKWALTKEELE